MKTSSGRLLVKLTYLHETLFNNQDVAKVDYSSQYRDREKKLGTLRKIKRPTDEQEAEIQELKRLIKDEDERVEVQQARKVINALHTGFQGTSQSLELTNCNIGLAIILGANCIVLNCR